MPVITIGTPFNIDLEFKVAAFSKRLLAWLIDIFIICVYYYLVLRFVYPVLGRNSSVNTAVQLLLIIIPVLLYQLFFELIFNGQTIGKRLAGIQVIDRGGQEPGWGQYLIRWILCLGNLFIYMVPYLVLENFLSIIGFLVLYVPDAIVVLATARSQRIGDLAAGTVVIDKNYRADISDTIHLDISNSAYVPMFPQVMNLSDRDINGIRNLLHNKKPARHTADHMVDVSLKIKTVLGIESDLHARELLEQLLRDYNYFTSRS